MMEKTEKIVLGFARLTPGFAARKTTLIRLLFVYFHNKSISLYSLYVMNVQTDYLSTRFISQNTFCFSKYRESEVLKPSETSCQTSGYERELPLRSSTNHCYDISVVFQFLSPLVNSLSKLTFCELRFQLLACEYLCKCKEFELVSY